MDINCWQFFTLAWYIDVTGDHTWQLQMTARRPSSMVMFIGTSGHDMVNIRLVDYVYRYKNIATDMSWYECLELIGLGTGTVTVHSEIHYTYIYRDFFQTILIPIPILCTSQWNLLLFASIWFATLMLNIFEKHTVISSHFTQSTQLTFSPKKLKSLSIPFSHCRSLWWRGSPFISSD